ncbi:DUF4942 domain-containing protein [Noviherbaspirillum galbum]|uniref:DUF4942 domain-containing protein n=1 Tax=Noviherbaspirillum galbum TaxID=2709383 RepID=A0A6B3SHC5_9BURK|nr:DUF4942 domain-containing protein [Noviherbaspirillum galbum]NEX60053.1 DUF4942 domain-containing protein [Noviherbaspirillum galbum]
MDNFQFYPTGPMLATKMWAKFKNRDFRRVLEGSAGEGDLALAGKRRGDLYHRSSIDIDVCEIDVTKHPILREKGLNVVGLDFLQFAGAGAIYSHICLNPPFKDGVRHALHAWNLLWDGELVVLLNAETIRNPFSQERRHLVDLIEQHGEVEFITDAFKTDDVRRKADVEVALVYLRKVADTKTDIIGNLFDELQSDKQTASGLSAGFSEDLLPSLPNTAIENLVLTFNAAVRAMREATFAQAKSNYYTAMLGETMAMRDSGQSTKQDGSVSFVQERLAREYHDLKDRAWASVLRSTNVREHLSSAAQQRLESEFKDIKKLEFTVANIHGFLHGLISSKGAIFEDMCCDVFDLFTKYHSENTVYFKGWKSNDRHRQAGMRLRTTRVILPNHRTESYCRSMDYRSMQLLGDFDKVFAVLDGKRVPEVGLVDIFTNRFADLRAGERVESSYFDVRYYPAAGTIHFFAKSAVLIDRLNRMVGRKRAWLPPENERVSDAFWLQYDKAEKFDKQVRAEVKKRAQGRSEWGWVGPLDTAFGNRGRGDEEAIGSAQQLLAEALVTVLEQNGISTDFRLTDESPKPQQPLLLELA